MARLVLGPLLRHVGERTATVWVETDRPCVVRVLDSTVRTFTVHGHHYALVDVGGLAPGSDTPYDVALDGERVWPEPDAPFPPSRIRTIDPDGGLRVTFGSCRRSPSTVPAHGFDALAALAHRLVGGGDEWPSVLLLIGDQVYADELSEDMREHLRRRHAQEEPRERPPARRRRGGRRRRGTAGPAALDPREVADFADYTYLYRLAWRTDPAVRWLLSTVPTFMIFDDHDVRDDWNTSYAWRREMWSTPWWRRRVTGGLGSYWIYQHLGNLTPDERAADPLYAAVRAAEDGGPILDDFAEQADRDPARSRWSYAHDLGGSRLIVVDSRCARVLTADRRAMLDDGELGWLDTQFIGDRDHLLIASSLPYLLPPAIHHAESWDEAVAGGAWGPWTARLGERLRRAADLEHWAAFEATFAAVARGLLAVARGERGRPPAGITFLSGDIHYSYLARVTEPSTDGVIAQVVCSPLRNPLAARFRWANVVACGRTLGRVFRAPARLARVPRPPLAWRLTEGPWFQNAIATVEIDGGAATVRWETPSGEMTLTQLGRAELTA